MSKSRMVNTRFWKDVFITDKCNALDRLLFLYLLTNEQTNMIGVYEVSLRTVAMETGIDRDDVEKTLKRLSPKIEYLNDGWIYIRNFAQHQQNNPNIEKGMARDAASLPARIREEVENLGIDSERLLKAFKGFQRLGEPKPNLNLNLNPNLTKPLKEKAVVKKLPKDISAIDMAFKDFIAHRKLMKKPATPRALELVKISLDKWYPDDEEKQIECINRSIENGWAGVFELPTDTKNSRQQATIREV